MNKEIWKDIPNYEGLYQASNLGNIRSLDRIRKQYNHNGIATVKYKGKILKQQIKRGTGYYVVRLYDNNKKSKTKLVHRLIAETFIQNKNNFPVINHIDGNKKNNNITNLEWCTQSHNVKESYRLGLQKGFHISKKMRGDDVYV